MSSVYAKSVEGCVIDQEEAFERAGENARAAQKADRLASSRRGGRLSTLILAFFVSGLSAAVGVVVGPDIAQSAFGIAMARMMNPVVDIAMGIGVIEYLIGGIFLAILGLVWYIRG